VVFIVEVRLIGFEEFDKSSIEKIKGAAQPLIDEFGRIFGEEHIQEFKIAADTLRKKREKYLYEVIGSFNTTLGSFKAKKSGWDLMSVIDEVIDNLERQILEKKEMQKKRRKLPANA